MGGANQIATHNEYVALETLVASGMTIWDACEQLGLPLGAFKTRKGDREWYERIVELSKEAREGFVLTKLVQNVERSMQATPVLDHEGEPTGEYTYQGSVANKSLELLGKTAGMFVDRTEVAHTGEIGVNHPDLIASFDSWVAKLAELAARGRPALGSGNGAGEAAPAAALPLAAVERKAGAATTGG